MVFVPLPAVGRGRISFLILVFCFVFCGKQKRPRFDAYAETRTMLSRCHLVSRFYNKTGLFVEMPTHSPRYNGHDPSQDTSVSPARSAVHLNDRFLRGFHQHPCSLRGRIRPLSPLHSLWRNYIGSGSVRQYSFQTFFVTIHKRRVSYMSNR